MSSEQKKEPADEQPEAPESTVAANTSDEPTLPSEEEIARLPRRGVVAYAARCARRVQPLFRAAWIDAPEEHVEAVDAALQTAESYAANNVVKTAVVDAYAGAKAAAEAAVFNAVVNGADPKGPAYAYAAAATADAVRADTRAAASAAVRAAASAVEHTVVRVAASAVEHAAALAVRLTRHDFNAIQERLTDEQVGPDAPVDVTLLGPLWPEGPPETWPESARQEAIAYDEKLVEKQREKETVAIDETIQRSESNAARVENLAAELAGLRALLDEETAELRKRAEALESDDTRHQLSKALKNAMRQAGEAAEQFTETNSMLAKAKGEVEAFLEEAEQGVKAYEEAYKVASATRKPVEFWKNRHTRHWNQFIGFGAATVAFGVAGAVGVFVVFYYDCFGLFSGEANLNPWRLGSAALLGTMLLLLMRVLTRVTMSNLHLATEADERVVMTEAFLALLQTGTISRTEHRELILNALFRPSTTGLVKEDAVPASMLDLATRVAQGQK